MTKFRVSAVDFFEREVRLRMPYRFGAATLAAAPQAFVRARIRLDDGREAEGGAAELLAPKWFDKDPSLSAEQNFDQLRASLALARDAYLAAGDDTAFGHSIDVYGPQIALAAAQGLNSLVAGFGPALIDRALLDALCRALGISFFEAVGRNVTALEAPGWQADLMAFDLGEFLAGLKPRHAIAARHTVGLLDALAASRPRLDDGLPESLEEAIERYGHRWFKLKLSGDTPADLERLCAIAAVLERITEPYHVTLDGNEQFSGVEPLLELVRRMKREPRLKRLFSSVAYIEQPINRAYALSADVSEIAEDVALIIDESDDSLEAFPRARRLGYTGVSAKTCKGFYKSLLNAARCRLWNMEEGGARYFISAEDLTLQPGLGLQQDLAVAALLGLAHAERNGHYYVNGMAGAPDEEQQAFLEGHPDLYERSHGAVRPRIQNGEMRLGSLWTPGFASRVHPVWDTMTKW